MEQQEKILYTRSVAPEKKAAIMRIAVTMEDLVDIVVEEELATVVEAVTIVEEVAMAIVEVDIVGVEEVGTVEEEVMDIVEVDIAVVEDTVAEEEDMDTVPQVVTIVEEDMAIVVVGIVEEEGDMVIVGEVITGNATTAIIMILMVVVGTNLPGNRDHMGIHHRISNANMKKKLYMSPKLSISLIRNVSPSFLQVVKKNMLQGKA